MTQTFLPLVPQPPLETPFRQMIRTLPEISLPWLDLGLALGILVMLRLA